MPIGNDGRLSLAAADEMICCQSLGGEGQTREEVRGNARRELPNAGSHSSTAPTGGWKGRYHHASERDAPLAVVLHPHPLHGGTMNNRIVYDIYHMFVKRGFSVLRFNFRGVGRSQESFDHGQGELRDAAAALDWMQLYNPNAKGVWVAGISFGAWIGMQLLMRPSGDPGLHQRCVARQSLRFQLPRPLPVLRPDRERRPRYPGDRRIGRKAGGEAEAAARSRHGDGDSAGPPIISSPVVSIV